MVLVMVCLQDIRKMSDTDLSTLNGRPLELHAIAGVANKGTYMQSLKGSKDPKR